MNKILIVGATSSIAHETAKCFAGDGKNLFLAGRFKNRLQVSQDDLIALGAGHVHYGCWDARHIDQNEALFNSAIQALGGLDAILIAQGVLPDQAWCESNPEDALENITVNGTSSVSLMLLAANFFQNQGHGSITVISSAAGVRGRRSTYIYGIGKSMHEEPEIPNYGPAHSGQILKEGMVFAIEPMVNLGSCETKILEDGWTVVTQDGKPSAHFEHSIVITKEGPEILTQ